MSARAEISALLLAGHASCFGLKLTATRTWSGREAKGQERQEEQIRIFAPPAFLALFASQALLERFANECTG
jgi:hypothetical protein